MSVLNAVGQKLGESMQKNRPNVKFFFIAVVAESLWRAAFRRVDCDENPNPPPTSCFSSCRRICIESLPIRCCNQAIALKTL